MSAVIDRTAQARIVTGPPLARTVSTRLHYDQEDPLAVRIVFPPEASLDGNEVAWTFARELLNAGLHDPAGTGDVHIGPAGPGRTTVELHSPDGIALVEFSTADLHRFLWRSYAVVPADEEQHLLDVDRHLAALFREE